MAVRRWEPIEGEQADRKRYRWAIPLLATILVGAAARVAMLDPLKWRGSSPTARIIAQDPTRGPDQHAHAIVTLQRECTESIASLRMLAQRDDETGARAQRALESLRRELDR